MTMPNPTTARQSSRAIAPRLLCPLGLAPAQARARGLCPLDSAFRCAGFDADAPFPVAGKESVWSFRASSVFSETFSESFSKTFSNRVRKSSPE